MLMKLKEDGEKEDEGGCTQKEKLLVPQQMMMLVLVQLWDSISDVVQD